MTYAHNPGAAFSFLADKGGWQRWFFAVIAVVIALGLQDELRFVLLTSKATVLPYADAGEDAQQSELLKGLKISLQAAEGEKCPRCWHYTTDVGQSLAHPELCGRCVTNVDADGEQREFA